MPSPHVTLDADCSRALEHLRTELGTLRTGRASPALVEHLKAEYYGTLTPLVQLASITIPDPGTLLLQVWDAAVVPAIRQALQQSDLGFNPMVEGQMLRIVLPPLSEERRRDLVKLLKQKGEQARIRIRALREAAMHDIRGMVDAKTFSEDAAEVERKAVQRVVDAATAEIQRVLEAKEQELMTV